MVKKIPNGKIINIGRTLVNSDEINESDLINIYRSIESATDREITVVNQRLTWAIVITAAYITAEAFLGSSVIRDLSTVHAYAIQGVACGFMAALSASGGFICDKSYRAIKAAAGQKEYLRNFYNNSLIDQQNIFEEYLFLPRPFGESDKHIAGNAAAQTIPPLLVGMWVTVAIIEFVASVIFLSLNFH